MIHMYWLFHGGVGIDSHPEEFFTLAKDYTTIGYPYKVEKPRAVLRVRNCLLTELLIAIHSPTHDELWK